MDSILQSPPLSTLTLSLLSKDFTRYKFQLTSKQGLILSLNYREESFELPLDHYGIRDHKASGNLFHFVDGGNYQASLVLLEKYEPPILVCAINEVLTQIKEDASPEPPTLIIPFSGPVTKIKWGSKDTTSNSKVLLYGVQIGPETDTTQTIAAKTLKPSPLLRIHYEPIACVLQLIRVLKLPTSILIGQKGQNLSDKTSVGNIEVVHEIGDLSATITCLSFLTDKITWDPVMTSRNNVEPWRKLYG